MDRREALRRMSLLFGGTIIGSQLFLEGCSRAASPQVAQLFTAENIDFLGNIAETILPKTATPGAKEAGVGSVIPVIVRDCYAEDTQQIFLAGLLSIDALAKEKHGIDFQTLKQGDRTELLRAIDQERAAYEVVGGYPDGGNWNLLQELGADKDSIYAEIDSLEIPQLDPIHGLDGPMHKYWKK